MSEIDELMDVCGKFFKQQSPVSRVRDAMRGSPRSGFDRNVWRQQAELGITSVGVPESRGGLGMGIEASGRVLEVCGRYLTLEPFVSTLCLAQPLLVQAQCDRAMQVLASSLRGESIVAVAVPPSADLATGHWPVQASREQGSWRLRGVCSLVVDAPIADELIVPAATSDGVMWFLIRTRSLPAAANGMLLDGHTAAAMRFDSLRVEDSDVLSGPQSGAALTECLLTTGAVLVSSWLLGVASQAFDITLEHLKSRKQFGVHLGSFQALQHRMSALFCELAVGRAVIEAAQRANESNASDAGLLASAAKSRLGVLACNVTGAAIQYHGGMGMTEESDVGFYYKAARMGDVIAGHHFLHRGRAARFLGLRH